jgi:hypothetical protein
VLLNSDNIKAKLFELLKWQKMIYLLNFIIVFKVFDYVGYSFEFKFTFYNYSSRVSTKRNFKANLRYLQ